MIRFAKRTKVAATALASLGAAIAAWVVWGDWPNQKVQALPWRPDCIVVLGGGTASRWDEAFRMHKEFPDVPLLVTGDGGVIHSWLLHNGVPSDLLLHEPTAESTYENATLTAATLDARGARNVVLVTNWFHSPRALAVFRKIQPGRTFATTFKARKTPPTRWELKSAQRERVAALVYLLIYRVNSF